MPQVVWHENFAEREIFCFRFFSWLIFPQAPENNIRVISNFFENSRRYSQMKVRHRYLQYQWQICHQCQLHQWQLFFHRYQRHRRQILPRTAGVIDSGDKFAIGVNDTGAKFLPPVSTTFMKKFETALMVYSEAWGKLIHKKNLKSKISWHCLPKLINVVRFCFVFG